MPLIGVSASNVEEDTETALALAIVQALQIPLSASDPITEQVIDYLQGKKLLLTLDNMEHLVNGTGFILRILRQAKQVQLIVTSRLRLNVQVESVFRLQGLPTPDATIAQTKTDGVAYALAHTSVQLFVERAGRVRPELEFGTQNVEAVSQICRLVAGLPLGIELAAALVEERYLCGDRGAY